MGDDDARSKDVLGGIYEFFLSRFASAESKKGREFYNPHCVVKLLLEVLEPYQGRVYDSCCGSSGLFVQPVDFIRAQATGNGKSGRVQRSAKADILIWVREVDIHSNLLIWCHSFCFTPARFPRSCQRVIADSTGTGCVLIVRLGLWTVAGARLTCRHRRYIQIV